MNLTKKINEARNWLKESPKSLTVPYWPRDASRLSHCIVPTVATLYVTACAHMAYYHTYLGKVSPLEKYFDAVLKVISG